MSQEERQVTSDSKTHGLVRQAETGNSDDVTEGETGDSDDVRQRDRQVSF